ncbi:terminase large subunit [Pseudanabaena phage Pam4]|nr:terminase large subunit [Pseudanabaena phage Pam4]
MWLELGGRGTGKTEGAAHYVNAHAEGPACDHRIPGGHKMLIVAPTQGDAVDACVTGVSGLQTINPGVRMTTSKGGTFVRWPNGTRAKVLGAHGPEDVERLRAAGNNCVVWLEEVAAMRQLAAVTHHTRLGLRIGSHPHYVGSTTPKARDELLTMLASPRTIVTRGRTQDATRLDPATREVWEHEFGGTTLGRQELDGEVLTDVQGALWVHDRPDTVDGLPNDDDRPGIENTRLDPGAVGWVPHDGDPVPAPLMVDRTVVAVDPPGGHTEAGIVVAGAKGGHGYLLADLSAAVGPREWGTRAIRAYQTFGASGIVLETNYGGDMPEDVLIAAAEALGVPVPPIYRVHAKVGKRLRAEPVVALYQQGRVHHVGVLDGLETEQRTWVPDETPESPNRIDAAVYALTHLLIRARPASSSRPRGAMAGTYRAR